MLSKALDRGMVGAGFTFQDIHWSPLEKPGTATLGEPTSALRPVRPAENIRSKLRHGLACIIIVCLGEEPPKTGQIVIIRLYAGANICNPNLQQGAAFVSVVGAVLIIVNKLQIKVLIIQRIWVGIAVHEETMHGHGPD